MNKFIKALILIGVITIVYNIQKRCSSREIESDFEYYKNLLQKDFDLLVSFKNIGRQWGIYLSKTKYDISKIKQKKYPIGDPYKVPQYPDIEFAIKPTQTLYDKCEIYDRIQKLANSNKCILYHNDSIFRYNCYYIPEKIRIKIKINEWSEDEVGFWKLDSAPNLVVEKK